MSVAKKIVVHHDNCHDGITALWCAMQSPAWKDAEHYPGRYDVPPDLERLRGADVLVVDFSWKRGPMLELAAVAEKVLVLDHHLSAFQEMSPIVDALAEIELVQLGNDKGVAIVDADDFAKVSEYAWSASPHGGAIAYIGGGREHQKSVYMHRLIMDAPEGVLVDHRNRNSLDNRRLNLRFATKQQNAANMDRGSKWKGIRAHRDKWCAQITINGENKHLGVFESPEDAARAYDEAAKSAFGDFALLNFGDPPPVLPTNLFVRFDMHRSGAGLAWDVLCEGPRPSLVNYVEDRDLWRFSLPKSKEVHAACASYPLTLEQRGILMERTIDSLASEGRAILRYHDKLIESAAKWALRETIGGHDVPSISCPTIEIFSDLGHVLCKGERFAAVWTDAADGTRRYSLRSDGDAGIDVSEIAKAYGGGGHRNAAGFTRPATTATIRVQPAVDIVGKP